LCCADIEEKRVKSVQLIFPSNVFFGIVIYQLCRLDPLFSKKLGGLTLGCCGDLDMVNITGFTDQQIKAGFRKTSEAFQSFSTPQVINLIVAESINLHKQAIGFSEALYGNDCYQINSMTHKKGWSRQPNGLFHDPFFSQKIGGVIAMFKKNHTL